MDKLISTIKEFLTPFSWSKFLSLIAICCAVALATFFTGCHVARECRSFATVKVDRIDTIEYNSRYHHDYKYNFYKNH